MLNWGILGCGNIAIKFCDVLMQYPQSEHKIIGFASRDKARAGAYAKKYNCEKAYSYDEMSKDPTIDIIYIATNTNLHAELSIKMLNMKKHVLCEKPMAMSAESAKLVIETAKRNKVFFTEGLWSRYFPVYKVLKDTFTVETNPKAIASDMYDDILHIDKNIEFIHIIFKKHMNKDLFNDKNLGNGAVLSLGCYAIQLVVLLLGRKFPKIRAKGTLYESGADANYCAQLVYDNIKVLIKIETDTKENYSNAIIGTEKGLLEIPNFHKPTSIILDDIVYDYSEKVEYTTMGLPITLEKELKTSGFMFQINTVKKAIDNKKLSTCEMSHEDSIVIAMIQDEILKQLEVVY
jgi:predicted dehydrogenase